MLQKRITTNNIFLVNYDLTIAIMPEKQVSEKEESLHKMMDNYIQNTIQSKSNMEESNFSSGEEEQRYKIKQHLLNRLDFIQKNGNSDRSLSPHVKSVYSKQAHVVSPGGFRGRHRYGPSEGSSSKSISKHTSSELDAQRRFIMQGLAITTSNLNSKIKILTRSDADDTSPVSR
jgi:hypothetical protein